MWQIRFRSLHRNTLYIATVYGGGSSVVELTGADVPFETIEDDTEDMFVPVRTQSGYLRFIDDGTVNWRGILPTTDTDRPVILTREDGTVVWQGFLQAQNFGSRLYGAPQIIELPLQCPLSVTSRKQVDVQHTSMENFAYLLNEVLLSIPYDCRPTEIVIQGGSSVMDKLMKIFDWQNLVEVNGDGAVESRFNLLECLEEMCRFWGWTARMHQQTLYLMCAYDQNANTFLTLDLYDLSTMASGTEAGWVGGSFVPAGFSGEIFASVNNEDKQLRGPNKVVVTADCNPGNSEVVKTFPDSVLKSMYDSGYYSEQYINGNRAFFTNDKTSFLTSEMTGSCASDVSFNAMAVVSEGNSIEEATDYSVVRIKPTYQANVVLASLETVYEHNFYDTPLSGFSRFGLLMSFDVLREGKRYEYADDNGNGKSTVHFCVGIGASRSTALWYDGTNWGYTKTSFGVRVGGTNREGVKMSLRTMNTDLHGRLFVDILGSDDMKHVSGYEYIDRFDLVNFTVEFERSVHTGISRLFSTHERKSQHDYTASNDNVVDEKTEISCVFVSDNDFVFGYGILMNPDGTPYRGDTFHPEQQLADRISNYWSASKRKLTCDLLVGNVIDITPKVVGTLDGTTVYPVSVGHDWRNDIIHTSLQQI